MKKQEKLEQLERLKKAETLLGCAHPVMDDKFLKGMIHGALVAVSNALAAQRDEILK